MFEKEKLTKLVLTEMAWMAGIKALASEQNLSL